jgi:hypothetical protein
MEATMRKVTQEMRAHVEMEGFVGLSDEAIGDIYYWLRLTPALCGTLGAVALVTASAGLAFALAAIAALGVILPRHPFDAIYLLGFRRRSGSAAIPVYAAQRRFACAIACALLLVTGVCFSAGATTAGRLMSSALVLVGSIHAVSGFCVPSWIYNLAFGSAHS